MFEQLFKWSTTLRRHRNAPLVDERLSFLRTLADKRMPLSSLRHAATTALVLTHSLDLASRPEESICLSELERQADLWATRSTMAGEHGQDAKQAAPHHQRVSSERDHALPRCPFPVADPRILRDVVGQVRLELFCNEADFELADGNATVRTIQMSIHPALACNSSTCSASFRVQIRANAAPRWRTIASTHPLSISGNRSLSTTAAPTSAASADKRA